MLHTPFRKHFLQCKSQSILVFPSVTYLCNYLTYSTSSLNMIFLCDASPERGLATEDTAWYEQGAREERTTQGSIYCLRCLLLLKRWTGSLIPPSHESDGVGILVHCARDLLSSIHFRLFM